MNNFIKIDMLSRVSVGEQLKGLQNIFKVFNRDGSKYAFRTKSKLDLDTDGKKNPKLNHWDPDHQDATSLDPSGQHIASDAVNYVVTPGGMSDRHGPAFKVGSGCTVCYQGKKAHAVVADVGPKSKFGEGSIALHNNLGHQVIKDNRILNIGIDADVDMIWYPNISFRYDVTQAEIDLACEAEW